MQKGTLNILVADDEPLVAESVSLVLRYSGHAVDVVHDGEGALARLENAPGHYDILITDHEMGEVSGLDLVKRLGKSWFRGKIIVLSGSMTPRLEEAYLAVGVGRIMDKPFRIADLRKAVDELGASPRSP